MAVSCSNSGHVLHDVVYTLAPVIASTTIVQVFIFSLNLWLVLLLCFALVLHFIIVVTIRFCVRQFLTTLVANCNKIIRDYGGYLVGFGEACSNCITKTSCLQFVY